MSIIRCPQCRLPTTNEEAQTGTCPECGAALILPSPEKPAPVQPPVPAWHWTSPAFIGFMSIVLLFVGGVGGIALQAVVSLAEHGTPPSTQNSPPDDSDLLRAMNEVKAMEALTAKLRGDLALHKKHAQAAEEARKLEEDRLKELESLVESLSRDLDLQKKQVSSANARADAAERETTTARAAAGKSQEERLRELEALNKKWQKELDNQQKLTRDAIARAAIAQRAIDLARQERDRTIDQVRQEAQRTIDQIRQESQRTVEQIRRELNQQQQLTQQARTEAQKQKQLADELRRKLK